MQSLLQQEPDQFSTHLLDQQPFFQNDLSIINFIRKSSSVRKKKTAICAWNDNANQQGQLSEREIMSSPKILSQKKRIQDFLASIKHKNGDFLNLRAQFVNKKKRSSLDNYDSQRSQIFLPLNNTIITFPKSRSQSRRLQGEEKIILEKLYRKRQKSKIIPKEISINPSTVCEATQAKFPAKNYLAKNRTFMNERSQKKLYNPEQKSILNKIRKRFPNSHYKKVAGVLQFQGETDKVSYEKVQSFNLIDNRREENINIPRCSRKAISLNSCERQKSPIEKMYKTIHGSRKLHSINLGNERDFSISKVKQDARNTHLNRIKMTVRNDIQLLGSTMSKWKDEAKKRLFSKQ